MRAKTEDMANTYSNAPKGGTVSEHHCWMSCYQVPYQNIVLIKYVSRLSQKASIITLSEL